MVSKENLNSLSHLFILSEGKLTSDDFNVSTDTRSIVKGDVFIALDGENFKGSKFLLKAVEAGAAGIIFHLSDGDSIESIMEQFKGKDIFIAVVKNTLSFMQDLARVCVRDWQKNGGTVIGITGSNGKTTHKEMLLSLIGKIVGDSVTATKGNLNNHIGVPLTIFKLEKKHKYAIIEMGSNHPGEISLLCDIANPDCGIITNIGESHLEFFKDKEGVFLEKSSLYEYIKNRNGMFVSNSDDPFLVSLPGYSNFKKVGQNGPDYFLKYITNKKISIQELESEFEITNENLPGRHNFTNLAVCLVFCFQIFPESKEDLILAASEFKLPSNNRSTWINWKNNSLVFLDAYNANPSSMKASLQYFFDEIKERSDKADALFVLGDMNELGENVQTYHQEIGAELKAMGAANVVFVGRYSQFYREGFGDSAKSFQTLDQLQEYWQQEASKFKWIFLKASRSLQLESLLDIK